VNFDVPAAPEDYIHRVGRTARAEMTGEAFTFASPEEAEDLRAIERAIGKPLPRVTLPDFDYAAKPTGRLEIPIAERIAKLRAQRSEERARAKAKEERRAAATAVPTRRPPPTAAVKPSPNAAHGAPQQESRGEQRGDRRDGASSSAPSRRRRGGGGGGGRGGGGGGGRGGGRRSF